MIFANSLDYSTHAANKADNPSWKDCCMPNDNCDHHNIPYMIFQLEYYGSRKVDRHLFYFYIFKKKNAH